MTTDEKLEGYRLRIQIEYTDDLEATLSPAEPITWANARQTWWSKTNPPGRDEIIRVAEEMAQVIVKEMVEILEIPECISSTSD